MANTQQKTVELHTDNANVVSTTTVTDTNNIAELYDGPFGAKYIGARYVPIFADPLEWNRNNTYEHLTVVYYQGNSYISKIHVPSGIEITNTKYWVRTADYDAQLEEYRQIVTTYDERITQNANNISTEAKKRQDEDNKLNQSLTEEITNRKEADKTLQNNITSEAQTRNEEDINLGKRIDQEAVNRQNQIEELQDSMKKGIIIIGDSWSAPTTVSSAKTWSYFFENYKMNYEVFNYAYGGARVTHPERENIDMKYQVDKALNLSTLPSDNIEIIILEGGINDFRNNWTSDEVVSGFREHITRLKGKFTKARVIVVLNHQVWVTYNLYKFMSIIRFSLQDVAEVYSTLEWFRFPSDYNKEDYVHPNETGYKKMCQNMCAIMFGGGADRELEYLEFTLSDDHSNKITFNIRPFFDPNTFNLYSNIAITVSNTDLEKGVNYKFHVSRNGQFYAEGGSSQWKMETNFNNIYNIYSIPYLFTNSSLRRHTSTIGQINSNQLNSAIVFSSEEVATSTMGTEIVFSLTFPENLPNNASSWRGNSTIVGAYGGLS